MVEYRLLKKIKIKSLGIHFNKIKRVYGGSIVLSEIYQLTTQNRKL